MTLVGIELEDIAAGQVRVLLPCDNEELCRNIRDLSSEISNQWEAAGLADCAPRVRIVLEEAVINAWKYGNMARAGRPITVRWREGNDFHLEVIDTGNGFDPGQVTDPTLARNLFDTSGRGIFMIRMYADEAHWRDGGRCITASFHRHSRQFDNFRRKPYCNLIPIWQTSIQERS